ncbi:MAG: DUF192 domain-containing protein [Phycisphaerales bacterium]
MATLLNCSPTTRTSKSLIMMIGCCVLLLMSTSMVGCSRPAIVDGKAIVELDGTAYTLDIVADDATRERGLGGVTELPEFGGMLFAFPRATMRAFVMRDCVIDIDIIFLDSAGRIVAMHHMPVEPPRTAEESLLEYESRLKRYTSRFAAQYAIEIRGGALESMNLEQGQMIELDTEYLETIIQ